MDAQRPILFVELGPRPALRRYINCLPHKGPGYHVVGSMNNKESSTCHTLLLAIGQAFAHGLQLSITHLYTPSLPVPIPTYVWDRETLRLRTKAQDESLFPTGLAAKGTLLPGRQITTGVGQGVVKFQAEVTDR